MVSAKKNKIRDNVFFVLLGLTFLWVGYRFYNNKQESTLVKSSPEFVQGQLTSYSSIGTSQKKVIRYSYVVEGKSFANSFSSLKNFFKGCEYDFSICLDKKFWVAYQKDDPSNSLINLDIEIQDVENPVPPKTLNGFW